jgi:hypothetical protein
MQARLRMLGSALNALCNLRDGRATAAGHTLDGDPQDCPAPNMRAIPSLRSASSVNAREAQADHGILSAFAAEPLAKVVSLQNVRAA